MKKTWKNPHLFVTGNDLTYFRFGSGQPDKHQRCMHMKDDNLWYSDECEATDTRAFICQQG